MSLLSIAAVKAVPWVRERHEEEGRSILRSKLRPIGISDDDISKIFNWYLEAYKPDLAVELPTDMKALGDAFAAKYAETKSIDQATEAGVVAARENRARIRASNPINAIIRVVTQGIIDLGAKGAEQALAAPKVPLPYLEPVAPPAVAPAPPPTEPPSATPAWAAAAIPAGLVALRVVGLGEMDDRLTAYRRGLEKGLKEATPKLQKLVRLAALELKRGGRDFDLYILEAGETGRAVVRRALAEAAAVT